MTDLEQLANVLSGWRSLGERPSDGEVMCAGCWDRSEHDTEADHDIPRGAPVFWSSPHPEYDDCDAYCASCAAEDAHAYELITDAELAALRARAQSKEMEQ
jgi:hypothetical protein